MATTVARLEAVLSANTRDFDRAMDKSHSRIGRVGKAAGVMGLALGGAVVLGLERSVKAAMHAQTSQERLERAFTNVHKSMGPYEESIKKVEAAGRKLGFTDEQTKTSLGSLLTATGSYTRAVNTLATAQDIARFKGVRLDDATKMLTMAMTGSQRAAKQLGITVPPVTAAFDALGNSATDAEKKHAKFIDKMATGQSVIDAVKDKLHGQAKAYADTAAGGMAQYQAQVDHLQVALGTTLLPAITKVLTKITAFGDYLSNHPKLTKGLELGVAALTAALLTAAAAQLALNLAVLANPYVAATVAIIAFAAGVAILYARFKELRPVLEFALETFVGLPLPLRVAVAAMGGIQGAVEKVTGVFRTLWHWIQAVVDQIQSLIKWLGKIHVPSLPSWLPGVGGHGGGNSSGFHANAQQSKGLARTLMVNQGWGQDQFGSLDRLWTGESGWRWNALNASSGAYGIPQSLPASKMASAGSDWRDNAATQISWGLNYIKGRYGSPNSAYSAWQSRSPHWYEKGGVVPGFGPQLAVVHGGETITPAGGGDINLYIDGQKLFSWFQGAQRKNQRRNSR